MSKRYLIVYNDETNYKTLYGYFIEGCHKTDKFETDDFNEYIEYLELVKTSTKATFICGIDTIDKKILYFSPSLKKSNIEFTKYEILEQYLGDKKTINDFYCENYFKLDFIERLREDKRASIKYTKYLTEKWGEKKDKKKLPSLLILDDPYMQKIEVETQKKKDKDKLKKFS